MKNSLIITMVVVLFLQFGCKETFDDAMPLSENQVSITVYLERHQDKYSSWLEILEKSGLSDAYRASGLYTVYIPNNEAVSKWLDGKTIDSFDAEYLQQLVKNHTLNFQQLVSQYRHGATRDTNLIGRNMSVDFRLGDQRSVILNKSALITHYDIKVANGYVNIIDHVLELKPSVIVEVETLSDCSIFIEALKHTGYDKILGNFTQEKREYYSILVETNEMLKGYNPSILSVDDLITRFSNNDQLTSLDNGLNQWVGYHIVNGAKYTNLLLKQDEIRLWKNFETQYKNHAIEVLIENEQMYINKRGENQYTQLDETKINIPASNGCIHYLKQPLHITQCRPTPIEQDIWDIVNKKAIENYNGNHSRRNLVEKFDFSLPLHDDVFDEIDWDSSPKKLPIYYVNKITTMDSKTGNYYYTGTHGLGVRFGESNEGWVSFKTPYLAEGTYSIKGYGCKNPNGSFWNIYIDGIYQLTHNAIFRAFGYGYGMEFSYGIHLTEGVHTIKIEKKSGKGDLTFGGITYKPLK
ncbi:fasciclin domain-containing protein [Halosquirtibacter xylanolyticus]|uniref:fasciclin domain-containing protein n=1 Tax=Halosquirtibacter xylanolyticus TaxID=3374599 RepID=UPI003749A15E|nr:fasciclin domain-containing protein [Prolixibacteraceae bacterium]